MLKIHLQARNLSSTLARSYCIDLTRDLFNDCTVKTTYGSLGKRGRDKIYSFITVDEALHKIRLILLKRASAPKISGCQYQVIEFYQDDSLPYLDVRTILQSSSSSIQKASVKPKKVISLPLFDI